MNGLVVNTVGSKLELNRVLIHVTVSISVSNIKGRQSENESQSVQSMHEEDSKHKKHKDIVT